MMPRTSLPTRRLAEVLPFVHGGIKYYATLGYADEYATEPIEIFLQGGKSGSAVEAWARDTGVAYSLALQNGCTVDTLRNAVTRLDDGTAAGPGGKLLDLIAETKP